MSKAYPSNLTRNQYALLRTLLPPSKPGGRPRKVDLYEILNAIFYVLLEGIRWRALPGDCPPWQTVYTDFRNWRHNGAWKAIHDRLYPWNRAEQGRRPSPSEAVIDSQSVKSAAGVHATVGYDAGKQIKGRKRLIAVDTLGVLLGVVVTAASMGERAGAKPLLERVKQMGQAVCWLVTIWADGGFSGEPFMKWVMDTCRWIVQVVLRPEQTQGFTVLKNGGSWSGRSDGSCTADAWSEIMSCCRGPQRPLSTWP